MATQVVPPVSQCQGLAELVAFHLRDTVHVVNQLNIAPSLLHVSASKHTLLCADHDLGREME